MGGEARMIDPECCSGPMWLHCAEEVRDRGGQLAIRTVDGTMLVDDALVWECLECDRVRLIVVTGFRL